MNMGEHLRDRRASLHRPGLKAAVGNGAKQVYEDAIVSLPGVEQSREHVLV